MIKDLWGKIVFLWFLTILIIISFFTCDYVKAASFSPSSYTYSVRKIQNSSCQQTSTGRLFNCEPDSSFTSNTQFGTSTSLSSGTTVANFRYYTYASSTNKYLASNLYKFKVKVCGAQKPEMDYLNNYFGVMYWRYNTSNAATDSTLSNIPPSYGITDINGTNCFYIETAVSPPEDSRFIGFYFSMLNNNPDGYMPPFWGNSFYLDTLAVTSTQISSDTQNIINNQNQNTTIINNSINNLNNNLTDSDIDNPDDLLEDMEDLLPTNGVITQLIGLPITLYTKVLNSLNGTCQSFSLGTLYDHNLVMPCIELSSYLGNSLYTTIDLIMSGVFVLVIAKKMIKAFNNFTSLKDGDVINND